jgi:hypothetical protein
VLRQRSSGLGLALSSRLSLRSGLRLSCRGGRGSLRNDCSTWPGLCDRLGRWSSLNSLTSGYSDSARDYRGGRHAEACARDEIAAGDNRSSVLFSSVCTDLFGRLAVW